MSDNFEMLIDVDTTAEEAEGALRAVLRQFRKLGLIIGKPTSDCALGGKGYRPGPAVSKSYKLEKRECRFWELVTCGMEPHVGRGFNEWALGPACEGWSNMRRQDRAV
jgi:hypothetical protein